MLVREVETLWFRDTPWYEYPLLTLPLIGDVSLRRVFYMFIFSVPLYMVFSFIGYGFMGLVIGLIIGFILSRPPKSVHLELILITALTKPRIHTPSRKVKVEKQAKPVKVKTFKDEPLKVYGVLRAPDGSPIQGAKLKLLIDGKPIAEGLTDERGRYVFYVKIPEGLHVVSVLYDNLEVLRRSIIVEYREEGTVVRSAKV